MRLLLLAVSLSALAAGSFWALTRGPLAPSSDGPGLVGPLDPAEMARPVEAEGPRGPSPLPPAPERPAVERTLEHRTYVVTGQTVEAVLASLMEGGPRDGEDIFFGLTQTELDVRYDPVEVSGGCLIEDTEVDLALLVTMPEWVPGAGAAPDLQRQWGRFRRALAAHEAEHVRIADEGAEASYRAVAGLFRPTCEKAVEEARRRLERLGVEIAAEHRRFDDETEHGRLDGAVWPLDR